MLEIKNLSKYYSDQYGNKVKLFTNISFTIEEGKITSIIAPVGSGKTSLLKIISRLEHPNDGEILVNGNGKIIYIPPEPSSFPWLSVKENVVFALNSYSTEKISELINIVGLEGYSEHYPDDNSLGFRFRIALARSLAHNPKCICIDEPFNKMDLITKLELYQLLRKIKDELKTTLLITTTNITEAILLSDRIYLMGKVPASIFEAIQLEIDDPRDLSIINSEKFNNYINIIENHYKQIDGQKILFKTI